MSQRLISRPPGRPPEADALRSLRLSAGLSQTELADQCGYSLKTISRWELGHGSPRLAVLERLQSLVTSRRNVSDPGRRRFKFVDLFAGIGGLRIPFDRLGGECVFTSEWDLYAQKTYRANFSCDHTILGDITKVPVDHIPPHDLLLAGFPCQPFSIAGVSKKNALGRPHGFGDTQGTLFFDVARILAHHRPAAFLLENVKNLKSHDHGRTFKVIMDVLRNDLGYHVQERVIDAKGFVPQHRERIFIVGFRDHNDFDWNRFESPDPMTGPRLGSILHPEDGTESPEPRFTTEKGRVDDRYYLTPKLWAYLQAYAAKHRKKGNGFGFGLVGRRDTARTLSARYYKDGAEILIRTKRRVPRRLTPRECARLMGFDGPREAEWVIPVSDTRAYKQFGNAVVVPVVEEVARLMRPYLLGEPWPSIQLELLPQPAAA